MSWWWVISRSTWRGGRGGGRTRTRTHKQQERHEEVVLINNLRIHPPTRRGASFRWLVGLVRGVRRVVVSCPCVLPQVVVVVVVGPASQLHGGCHALVLVLVRLHFTSLHVVVVVVVVLSLTLVWCVFSALSVLAVGFLHLRYVHHLCLV